MPTAAREYLSKTGVGDMRACEHLLAEVTCVIRESFDTQNSNRHANFLARIIVDEQECEEEGISKDEVELHSQSIYPFLWINFTYDPTRVPPIAILALENRFELTLIGTAESDSDFY
jgi:hypothetical protein